uniref:B2 mating type protein n=1 Tax=Heterobasidion occidentale TaxID=942053 RepID=S5RTQ0_9AGAM|nr:b2 mating type protein [Heterobasidion occidentale]
MSYSDRLRRIASESERLQSLSGSRQLAPKRHHSLIAPLPSSAHPFPAPKPLTSDLLALGLHPQIAKNISQIYLQIALSTKETYEIEFRHAEDACLGLILKLGCTLPIHSRLRSTYVSRFLATTQSWVEDGLLTVRQCLLGATLKRGISLKLPTFVNSSHSFKTEIGKQSVTSKSIRNHLTKYDIELEEQKRNHKMVNLTSLFQFSNSHIKPERGILLHQEAPDEAFPTKYYRSSASQDSGACLKILSCGLRRATRQSSRRTSDVNSLVTTLDRLSTEERSSADKTKNSRKSLDLDCQHVQFSATLHSSTPSASSSSLSIFSSPPSTHSSNSSVRRSSVTTLTSPYSSDVHSDLSSSFSPLNADRRKFAALPKKVRTVASPTIPHPPTIQSEKSRAISHAVESPLSTSLPVLQAERRSPPPVALPLTSSGPRRRKVAALPARGVPTSVKTIAPPQAPSSVSFAPLSVANVSSLSPPRSRSIISRTPSLVSLASNDSGSSSPSDTLDTPPSTPPPFITKFPSPISPSSLSANCFMPKLEPNVSAGDVFQFSSTREPKKFEGILPSERTAFSFSTIIKREEQSFSFAFGR